MLSGPEIKTRALKLVEVTKSIGKRGPFILWHSIDMDASLDSDWISNHNEPIITIRQELRKISDVIDVRRFPGWCDGVKVMACCEVQDA